MKKPLSDYHRSKSKRRFHVISARRPNVRHAQQGQAIVEFAMVMPILILLLLGVVFFAMAFNLQMALNAAAREGARAWASNRVGTSPCLATQNSLDPHECEPSQGTGEEVSDFQKNVIPLVRKYMTDNGYDGEKVVFRSVYVTKKELSAGELDTVPCNTPPCSVEDATKVKLIISYEFTLPTAGLGLVPVILKAEYTFKRGS